MSKVYFTNMRTHSGGASLLQKLDNLITKGGIGDIDMKDKFVAIKMHFGEYGNLSFLRPNFAKVIADKVKQLGGKPFLCDCNTLYTGFRHNALDHLHTAELNGFNSMTTGCNVIIGDGLKGQDEALVPINGEYVKRAHIGKALYDADVIISLAHFKGHETAGFGGTIKNLGMGGGSIAGKKDQHSSGKPQVDDSQCVGCKLCLSQCNHSAISYIDNKAHIDHSKCVGCDRCIGVCPKHCIAMLQGDANIILNKKIAEYTLAVINGKPNFNVNIIMDVSPNCDCHPENDVPIIPNVGMLCSFDPVAIDIASADLCNQQTPNANTLLTESSNKHKHDHFVCTHPNTDWRVQIEHGEKIGLGSSNYQLVTIK